MMAQRKCIYCPDSDLVKSPDHPEWWHCPTCQPEWINYINDMKALREFRAMRVHAQDQRGRPNRVRF